MSFSRLQDLLCRCLTRRWYHFLIGVTASFVIGVPVASVFLFGLAAGGPAVVFGALAGFASAFAYGALHVAMSLVGAMRCPSSIRAALAITISLTAVTLMKVVPLNLEFRTIPSVLTYCMCVGSLLAGYVYRRTFHEEFVGKGGRILTRSPPWSDLVLMAALGVFLWGQYAGLARGWYAAMVAPRVLFWSLVLTAASAWGFVTLSRSQQRRSAYAIAVPLSVVAMFMIYLQFRREAAFMPWIGFLAFAAAAPIGWCLALEVAARASAACGWKWRRIRRPRLPTPRGSGRPMDSGRFDRAERAWRSLAALYLAAVASVTLNRLTAALYRHSSETFDGLSAIVSPLTLGIGWACLGAFSVLVAHQTRHLSWQSLLTVGFTFSIAALSLPTPWYDRYGEFSLLLNTVVPTIAMTVVVHVLVRSLDRFSRLTIAIVRPQRKLLGINDLLMLTLLLACGFALLRFTDLPVVVFSTVTLTLISTITLMIFRLYLIGPSYQLVSCAAALIGLLAFLCIRYSQALTPQTVIGGCVMIAAVIAIVRFLARQGWQKMTFSGPSAR